MKASDFYNLHIGNIIWVNGRQEIIFGLIHAEGIHKISFSKFQRYCTDYLIWSDICENCSKTPPEKKKLTMYRHWYINGLGELDFIATPTKWDSDLMEHYNCHRLLKTEVIQEFEV